MTHLSIGERIRALRTEHGLTQKQLGERCGIAEPTIRRYELGRLNPKYGTLERIADALGTSVTVFLGPESTSDETVTPEIRRGEVANMDTSLKFTIHAAGWELDTVLTVIERIKAKYPDAEISIEM